VLIRRRGLVDRFSRDSLDAKYSFVCAIPLRSEVRVRVVPQIRIFSVSGI
jgi:hypothetical protein